MNFVRNLAITPEGVVIEFATPGDFKQSGLMRNQSLLVPFVEEYADLLDDLVETCHRTLDVALAAFEQDQPIEVTTKTDDGPSPYDNPDERPEMTS